MEFEFKNEEITNELFDVQQIKYATWIYDEDYDSYFDVVLSDKSLTIVGQDIISEHMLSKIGKCVAYFGVDDESYFYNYWDKDLDWRYGDGDILISVSDCSGQEWGLAFNQERFLEAKTFFIELRNLIRKE